MIRPDCILLDIEGTTSSISFVHDTMFPFARRHVRPFLDSHWQQPEVQQCVSMLAVESGKESLASWLDDDPAMAIDQVVAEVESLMDRDVKATGLKKLQGLIWQQGFESGELVAHVYDDVPAALRRWREDGTELRVYSSGSVQAQKLFFGHTTAGDLLSMFTAHYDTTTGPKKDPASYHAIATEAGIPADRMLFISDVAAELDAASSAGMRTVLSLRPENAPVRNADDYYCIQTFDELTFAASRSDVC